VRDRLFAYFLGPGKELDIYLTAFRIPDFLYVVLSTLISATVLIPLLSKTKDGATQEKTDEINTLFTVFFSLTGILSLFVFFLMPYIAKAIAPGFDQDSLHKLVLLSRLMLISPMVLAVSNFIGSINQYHKKFLAYAMAPVFYNIGIILGVSFLYKKIGLLGLGLGVICGAILHLGIQLTGYLSSTKIVSFIKVRDLSIIKNVLRLSIPRTLTLALFNLLLIVIISIASHFEAGSISLLTFSFNIGLVPLSLIGNSFATAAFPYLISLAVNDRPNFYILIEKLLQLRKFLCHRIHLQGYCLLYFFVNFYLKSFAKV
jgi:putative peptidoglycan lipid II flippase